MTNEPVTITTERGGNVSGIYSLPDSGRCETGLILAHGAGNDMTNPLLTFVAEGLAHAGCLCLRFNFPYKEQGRKVPDREPVLYDTWRSAYRVFADRSGLESGQIVAAGKSMGGRIASQMTAAKELPAGRLIFYGYPLHSPGKTEKLQDAHLYKIRVPMLFFAGSRDALCSLPLLRQVHAKMEAPTELEVIEGGDHSFKVLKSYGISPEDIYSRILARTVEWLGL